MSAAGPGLMKDGAAILAGAIAGVAIAAAVRHARPGSPNKGSDEGSEDHDAGESGEFRVKLDPRSAVLYFTLHFQEYNFNEDVEELPHEPWKGEYIAPLLMKGALRRAVTGRVKIVPGKEKIDIPRLMRYETKAVEALRQALPGAPGIINEGHDEYGDLEVKIWISSVGQLRDIRNQLIKMATSGLDCISVELDKFPYFEFRDFKFHPSGETDEVYDLINLFVVEEGSSLRLMASEDEEWER